MSLSALSEIIIGTAQKQAQEIEQEGIAAVHATKEKITSQLNMLEEEIIQRAQMRGEIEARRIHQRAALEGRSNILLAKQEELDAVKQEFLNHLATLENAKSKALLQALLMTLPKEKGEITAGEKSQAILKKLVATPYTLSKETIADEGGFIFRGKNMEINFTFSYIVEDVFKKNLADIAKELFSYHHANR